MKNSEFMNQKASKMTVKELKAAIKIKQKDTWNLADDFIVLSDQPIEQVDGKKVILRDDIKTFIQKVKKDLDNLPWNYTKAKQIIDKRAGKL